MGSRFLAVRLSLLGILALSGCRSPYYADKGAALGGVAGALAGAAIGDSSGKAGPGALIGGAVGALTGAAIGDAIDTDIAYNNALIEQQLGRPLTGAVTMDDVLAMTHAQLSENVIVTHIRANGVAKPPDVPDLIALRNQGVSEAVIQTMQQTPPPQAQTVVAPRQQVYVEQRHIGVPVYHYDPWCDPWHHDFHHHRHRSGIRWGVSFHGD